MKRTPSGESESVITLDELLKLKETGQFPGDPVKIEDTQIHFLVRHCDVQGITGIKTIG